MVAMCSRIDERYGAGRRVPGGALFVRVIGL